YYFFFLFPVDSRYLHSFPTRRSSDLGIPLPIYIMIILFVVMSFVARYRPFGRHVYAVGGNEEAAKMMGLPVDRIKIKVYVLSSRSEEHTSELQSRENLVCRLLLEKKK